MKGLFKQQPFFPAGLFAAVMFVGYSLPTGRLEEIKEARRLLKVVFSDFSLHFFLYAFLAVLLTLGFSRKSNLTRSLTASGLIAFGYGTVIEFWQGLLPYRTFRYGDMINNFLGVLCGLLVFWILVRMEKLRVTSKE